MEHDTPTHACEVHAETAGCPHLAPTWDDAADFPLIPDGPREMLMTDSDDCPCLPSAESGTCPHGDRVLWAEFDQTPATPEPTPGADPFALLAACGDHILDLLIARHALAVAVQKIGNTMNRYVTTGLVNDAWRNQWHPAEGQHRPRWIAPYIKGPEGAPMLTQPKVYVWSRT